MRSLSIELRPEGPYVAELDLHLDPSQPVRRAFVSHAHGDHVGGAGAGQVIASRETLALVEARRGEALGARGLAWDDAIELPLAFGGTARLSIAPAGHVLGAAQLVVDYAGGRLVYTGDYQSGGGATHAVGAPIPCDALVIESTFALPMFRFPDRARTKARLVDWCTARLAEGRTPVVIAYALGKSQEVAHALVARGLPVVAHGAVFKVCAAYEALGVPLGVAGGQLRAYADEKRSKKREKSGLGAVLLVPPRTSPMIKAQQGAVVAYASGWAILDAAVEQQRADAAFVLSDHADYDDLVATARATGAKRVYTAHGDADVLAALLRRERIEATSLATAALDAGEEATA